MEYELGSCWFTHDILFEMENIQYVSLSVDVSAWGYEPWCGGSSQTFPASRKNARNTRPPAHDALCEYDRFSDRSKVNFTLDGFYWKTLARFFKYLPTKGGERRHIWSFCFIQEPLKCAVSDLRQGRFLKMLCRAGLLLNWSKVVLVLNVAKPVDEYPRNSQWVTRPWTSRLNNVSAIYWQIVKMTTID